MKLQLSGFVDGGKNEESSFYRRKEKIPEALKSSIMERTNQRRKTMKNNKGYKIELVKKMILKEKFVCGIC